MSAAEILTPSPERDAEDARLAALACADILDTPPEPAYDRVTRLVRSIFRVPMATVTLLDAHRQWFKSRQGIDLEQTPRGPALCWVAVREAAPLVVRDTLQDERFRDNPFVTGAPFIRFYAGAPLVMPDGTIVGTLCAMDIAPHDFDGRALAILTDLAGIVSTEIARRPPPADGVSAPRRSVSPPTLAIAPQASSHRAEQPTHRRVLKAGRIGFNAGRSVVDCTIRGLSEHGALIDVNSTSGIPEHFKLAILADDVSRACRVTGKRERFLEVEFE